MYARCSRHAASLALALLVVVAVPALPSRSAAQPRFDVSVVPFQESHLPNGLSVVIEEDHRVPLVSLALRYDESGAPAGQQATAALSTLLMMDATAHVGAGEYDRLLARAGATGVSHRTQPSGETLQVTVPSNQLALPLWLWSDQMGFPGALDDAQLLAQRTRLSESRRVALEGSPLGRLDAFAAEELYPPDHPYHYVEFTPQDAEHVDRAAVMAFHDAWMTPAHATLAVVGDVVAADALALVERYFGSIPRGPGGPSRSLPPPALGGETQVSVSANVPRAYVSVRWPTPPSLTPEDARLDVVAQILAGGRTAWLYWKLVDEMKVAVSVTALQRSQPLGSQFEIRVEGARGRTPGELLVALDAALDELRKHEPEDRELAGAVYENVIEHLLSLERTQARAADYVRSSAITGSADSATHDLGRYAHVDRWHIPDSMVRLLPHGRRVVLLVTPNARASIGGDRTGKRVMQAATP